MELLKKLKATNSRIEKELILHSANKMEKLVLAYAYNPYFVYHQKELGEIDWDWLEEPEDLMFGLLEVLRTRQITGMAAYDKIQEFAADFGDLIKLVVRKDLECGITATTINKVFPGLVPQFKVQLAKEVPLDKVEFPALAQLKYDGVRLVCLVDGTKVEFRTRSGKIVWLPEFANLVRSSFSEASFILDGEITSLSGKMEDRTKVSGWINSAMHGTQIDETKLKFTAFDAMDYADFMSTKCTWEYTYRFNLVRKLINTINNPYIQLAETIQVNNINQVEALYADKLSQGFEGLVLKSSSHLYSFKRSKDWIKMKEIKSTELVCIDVQEGTGKYEGSIGALICQGTVDGKQVRVRVGSGLTDKDRDQSPSSYIGKDIEVKYNTTIQDSVSKEWSLFLPRYVGIRFDLVT